MKLINQLKSKMNRDDLAELSDGIQALYNASMDEHPNEEAIHNNFTFAYNLHVCATGSMPEKLLAIASQSIDPRKHCIMKLGVDSVVALLAIKRMGYVRFVATNAALYAGAHIHKAITNELNKG